MKKPKLNQAGVVLTSIVVTLPPLIVITALFLQLAVNGFSVARKDQVRTHAQFAADAGVDHAIRDLNTGVCGAAICSIAPTLLHNNGDVKVEYEYSISPKIPLIETRTITAIGKTYRPVSSTPEVSKIILKVNVRAVAGGEYSVVAGAGGLRLRNSAKILGGDVFVNGRVELYNTAQIGLITNPVNLDVANHACPLAGGATYPMECTQAESSTPNKQPIYMENCNVVPKIYGTVRAHRQQSGACMQNGFTNVAIPPEPLPNHDRASQKALATTPLVPTPPSPPYNTDWDCAAGTHTWPADLKITGNVTIRIGCQVILLGDVWITGTLEVRNSGQIIVSDLVGTDRPDIMVDGRNIAENRSVNFRNTSSIVSNTLLTGVRLISYWRPGGCVPDTLCDNVTGNDLYLASDVATIELEQSASGPNTIFYSRWSKVLVHNSGAIGALAGQTVELNNSGVVTFGSSAGTGVSSWVIEDYRRQF